jgi:hypothetical protein
VHRSAGRFTAPARGQAHSKLSDFDLEVLLNGLEVALGGTVGLPDTLDLYDVLAAATHARNDLDSNHPRPEQCRLRETTILTGHGHASTRRVPF